MALLFLDSFDHYATADLAEKWSVTGSSDFGTIAIAAGAGRHSSSSFRFGTSSSGTQEVGYLAKVLAPASATMVQGFAVSVPTSLLGSAGVALAAVRDGSTTQVTLRVNSDFTLSVVRGTHAGTVLGTSTATLPVGAFAFLEWKVLVHNSTGTVDVRINGASALSLTAQDTQQSALAQWTTVILGMADAINNSTTSGGGAPVIDFDDLYVCDGAGAAPWNTFLGDCRVDVCVPTAAGATTGWTPLAGANYAAVDDAAPDDDTTYTATATVGAIDTFVTQDAPVAGATLFGAQVVLSLKKSDAGTCSVAAVVRHSTTNYPGADLSPGTSYAYAMTPYATNPGTGAAWTEAGFNAAEFGYTRTA